MRRRAGLTLIELLVVLAILVAISGIAIRATAGLAEQARFEATQRTLAGSRDAIASPPALRTDGARIDTGFVADLGRLPVARGASPLEASELWSGAGLPPFQVYATDDPQVSLSFGWRGPYVQLAPGETGLSDGWGRDLRLLDAGGGELGAAGQTIHGLRSLGQDAVAGGAQPYDLDLDATVPQSVYAVALTATVTLTGSPGAGQVFLRIYAPDASAGATQAMTLVPASAGAEVAMTGPTPSPWVLGPSDVATGSPLVPQVLTAGPRVVRAYYDANGNGILDLPGDIGSQILPVCLLPGSNGVALTIDVP